ncbi:hypothetical protein [Thermococcus celericrescens]|uniref:hypothetical protein n=1 Tax=Thermococcus celericrescens TaxID=227598 RepID=UPI0012ED5C18|nr:hypothetical protein [Thermococcus celericrescens]
MIPELEGRDDLGLLWRFSVLYLRDYDGGLLGVRVECQINPPGEVMFSVEAPGRTKPVQFSEKPSRDLKWHPGLSSVQFKRLKLKKPTSTCLGLPFTTSSRVIPINLAPGGKPGPLTIGGLRPLTFTGTLEKHGLGVFVVLSRKTTLPTSVKRKIKRKR